MPLNGQSMNGTSAATLLAEFRLASARRVDCPIFKDITAWVLLSSSHCFTLLFALHELDGQ